MGFLTKLKIFSKSTKLFKNWYVYPLVYFKLTKKEHVIFETKTGLNIKIRVNSTDLMALTHVWMIQEYSNSGFDINDSEFDIVGDYLGNVKDKITNADMMDLGIAVLHPDKETVDFLGEISEYMIPNGLDDNMSDYDRELANIIKKRVSKIEYENTS